jgi:uncharacterized protein YqeY
MLRQKIAGATRDAMKAQDKARLSALRMVGAAITNLDIEARGQGREAAPDEAVVALLRKLVKQREEAAGLYDKGGRADLAAGERAEIEVIRAFLPAEMSEADVRAAVAAAIAATGAAGGKDIGKVMAALKASHGGQMDFGKANAIVRQMLA